MNNPQPAALPGYAEAAPEVRAAFQLAVRDMPLVSNAEAHWRYFYAGHVAALQQAAPAESGEPFAYYVYLPDEQRGEFAHELDELSDELTNCCCEITELYATAPAAPQAV
jgi:hypothetical protein